MKRLKLKLSVIAIGSLGLGANAYAAISTCAAINTALSGLGGTANALKTALSNVQGTGENGGFNNEMWGTIVDRDGTVCAVVFTGADRQDQWQLSRVISAQKANTANGLSDGNFAVSTANWYTAAQPGGPLYGLQFSNPVDTGVAYTQVQANLTTYGTVADPMLNRRIGGVNVFGGGLPLYSSSGVFLGGLGVSGDTSCTDHIIAWKVRDALNLDWVPNGPASGTDNLIPDYEAYSTTSPLHMAGGSTTGWGHPSCGYPTSCFTDLPNLWPTGSNSPSGIPSCPFWDID